MSQLAIFDDVGISENEEGSTVLDTEEDHRFRCEVRDVLRKFAKGGRKRLEVYIALVEQKRGAEAAARLRIAAREQFKKGNKGDTGDWK